MSGLHTLYISPLKALAVDVRRNLLMPIEEMRLPIRVEARTGDTPSDRKARQRVKPPHILLTTPESLSLLLSHEDSVHMFSTLKRVIIDEVHAFANGKRGDLLSLSLARLQTLPPQMERVALSATVADPDDYRAWLAPDGDIDLVQLVTGEAAAEPDRRQVFQRIGLRTRRAGVQPLRIESKMEKVRVDFRASAMGFLQLGKDFLAGDQILLSAFQLHPGIAQRDLESEHAGEGFQQVLIMGDEALQEVGGFVIQRKGSHGSGAGHYAWHEFRRRDTGKTRHRQREATVCFRESYGRLFAGKRVIFAAILHRPP